MKTPVGFGTRTVIASQSYLLQPEENICVFFFNLHRRAELKLSGDFCCISGTEQEGWKAMKNISGLTEHKVNANQIS